MLEDGILSQLGTIVVDELHFIGDPSRGYLLEILLTKIRYMTSATMSSMADTNLENTNLDVASSSSSTVTAPLALKVQIQVKFAACSTNNLP